MVIESFKIIGLEVQTTNENGQASTDLGNLWQRFFAENISVKIPNKIGEEVYAIYTHYESDFRGKYTAIIGQKVSTIENIPSGMGGYEFGGGNYKQFIAKGSMPNAVVETWQEIWSKDKDLDRKYSADFEVYGNRSQNGDHSEVDIFIAIN